VNNTVLNSNFQVRAIYFDGSKRKWVGLLSGGVVILDTLKWKRINFPPLFPGSTFVNTNAITGDASGKVYIGTTNGLIVYEGGPVDSMKSYRLYDTLDGLPSNVIRGIAIDTFTHTIAIATANGIAIWDPACSSSAPTNVTTIADGNWSNPAIWSDGKVPGVNSIVTILHNVNIDIDAFCKKLTASNVAQISVSSGKKLTVTYAQ
jgi:ligand-binding sensor domain-containing protein